MEIKKYLNPSYNPTRAVILSNEIIENCRFSLYPQAFNLLMALSQSIDYTHDIWPEFEVEISQLFKFLNLKDNNGRRYEIVRDILTHIAKNPLEKRINRKRWATIPWLSADYDEEVNNRVIITFHKKVVPYLLAFKETLKTPKTPGYTKLVPLNYTEFDSKYATNLYPFFKKWQDKKTFKKVYVEREIQWIRERTYTEGLYEKNVRFLEKVVNKAIAEINLKTDLYVIPIAKGNKNIKAKNGGKTYSHIVFIITSKRNIKTTDNKQINKAQIKIFTSELELKESYEIVRKIDHDLADGIKNGQSLTYHEYAKKYNYHLHRLLNEYYLCK